MDLKRSGIKLFNICENQIDTEILKQVQDDDFGALMELLFSPHFLCCITKSLIISSLWLCGLRVFV